MMQEFDLEKTRELNSLDGLAGNTRLGEQVVYNGYAFDVCRFQCPQHPGHGKIYATRVIIQDDDNPIGYNHVHMRHRTNYHMGALWSSIEDLQKAIKNGDAYAA